MPGSPADTGGEINIGDIVVEVNGVFVLEVSGDDIIVMMKSAGTTLSLVFVGGLEDDEDDEDADADEGEDALDFDQRLLLSNLDPSHAFDDQLSEQLAAIPFAAMLFSVPRSYADEVLQDPLSYAAAPVTRIHDSPAGAPMEVVWAEADWWLAKASRYIRRAEAEQRYAEAESLQDKAEAQAEQGHGEPLATSGDPNPGPGAGGDEGKDAGGDQGVGKAGTADAAGTDGSAGTGAAGTGGVAGGEDGRDVGGGGEDVEGASSGDAGAVVLL